MTEIWRDIKGYEGLYQVSNLGNVKSLPRLLIYSDGQKHYYKEKILKPTNHSRGYLKVILCDNGIHKQFYVHRLVAEAFIPNPFNLPQVNHIDEDKTNNRVSNLEWCDSQYNNNYGTARKRMTEKQSIKVNQYTKDGIFIKQWKSLSEASRVLNISKGNLGSALHKKRLKTYYGFKWYYADDPVQYIDQPLW